MRLNRLQQLSTTAAACGIGQADVLAGQNGHAPEQEGGILAGIDHLGAPVEGCVRVGAAQGLDERGDGVVVDIALFVVEDGPAAGWIPRP